jgi:uncharacterized protein YjlB
MAIHVRPDMKVTTRQIPKWHRIPNTSIQSKPLMIYHEAFEATASELSTQLEEVGDLAQAAITPEWHYPLLSKDHFHSTTHSVLGVVSGRSRACFGGEQNPDRFETIIQRGDLIIIPAGVGHRLSQDLGTSDEPFELVLAYPLLKPWDICYGQPEGEEQVKNIQKVVWFQRDPLYGDDGPALHV